MNCPSRLDGRYPLITPEGLRLQLTPAGPAVRGAAWALDFLIWLVFMFIILMVMAGAKIGQGMILLALFISYWGYPVICEVGFNGRTIGKRALGIEVLRADGLPVGWRESILRNLLLVADFLPFLYAGGLLCMLGDRQFRRLGDLVAGTLVVYQPAATKRATLGQADALPCPLPLSPEQQRTLIDLFERERQLPPERLQELASIAEPLTGLTGAASVERLRGIVAGLTR